jgi:GntR family transcriptional regulator
LGGKDDRDRWDRLDLPELDRRGGLLMSMPMYRQIAEDLRSQIESGGLQPGQQLRTELELREHYGASRNTVRDAIKWLTTLGLVETRAGSGTFVVQKIDPFVTTLTGDPEGPGGGDQSAYLSEVSERKREPSFSPIIQVEIQQASEDVAISLRIPEGAEIISRHEKRFIDRIPWSMQTSYYPIEFADKGAERLRRPRNIDEGTVKYLAATLGLHQVGYRDWITVRAPNPIEADFFKLPSDGRVPMYENFRTAFDQNGQPMRLTVTVYPADRNQFIVNIGKVPEPVSASGNRETQLAHLYGRLDGRIVIPMISLGPTAIFP